MEATDISAAQLAHAAAMPNVGYSVRPAERSDFPQGAFDLIVAAQALHWFDFDRFWPEVRRVAKPGALFCAWGYSWMEGGGALQDELFEPLRPLLAPYWAAENRILWNGYRSDEIAFPYMRIEAPAFAIRLSWDIGAILAYVRTWSSYKRALADPEARTAIVRLEEGVAARFGDAGAVSLTMPLAIAAGMVD